MQLPLGRNSQLGGMVDYLTAGGSYGNQAANSIANSQLSKATQSSTVLQ